MVVGGTDQENAYERMLRETDAAEPPAPAPASAPAAIFYTSGTTGFPKGVVMSHLGLLTRFSSYGWRFGITEESVVLVPGPVFHQSFGGLALLVLCAGGRLVLHSQFDADHVVETLQRQKVTWSFMVPKMHSDVVDALRGRGPVPGCEELRGLLSSGSSLPTPVLEGLVEAFPRARIADAYGWTECGWVTYCRHEDLLGASRTVGRSSFGCEIAILDDDGRELGAGETGQIYAATPVPFLGYHENPQATASIRHGKWETGGDVGMLDDQGFLTIYDRKRDVIISGGENVYPAEIERVLSEHPKVLEVAVVGVPDARWGEAPRACVVLKPGESLSEAEILEFCVGKLARFKHPRSAVLLESLPRNSLGKTLRRELRERYWEQAQQRV
jgi:acyl-CoA synthetase (AMP-forming)/AMP-acid ligase II